MVYGQSDGPAAATRARAALSDISNSKGSARAPNGGKVRAAPSPAAPRCAALFLAAPPRLRAVPGRPRGGRA